ncbi:glycosyltransferase [Faecalispora anaeroviscerum]|uniref:glycosyltransferase n=1 Tax=Faecalispora anaeroviscerum TaxID=2991836 RepID=UPI0024BA7623|nr:glycosyltransferase [Faecalispora anaeroviscerum]
MEGTKQLSLCVITKNDAAFLPDCLSEMQDVADEILVVDLGSDDDTLKLAEQAGAKLYRLEWEEDFSKIKNFCMEHAAGKWVLFLQADEKISQEQREELKILLQNPSAEGYLLYVDYNQEERGISSPAQFLRLIRNRTEYRFCYRSFEYLPDKVIFPLRNTGIRITHRSKETVTWPLEERIRLLEEDVREHPQSSYVRYMEGIELLNQGEYEESVVPLDQARRAVNWGYLYAPHLYKCLGFVLISLERYQEAVEVLGEGIENISFYNDLLVLRAETYRLLNRNQEALEDLEACIALRMEPNASVPCTEIEDSIVQEMWEEIRANLNKSNR